MIMLPAEILHKVFSFIPNWQVYNMRNVCKFWKLQCEYHVYLSTKTLDQRINIKIGEKGNIRSISMSPYGYDSENQVIEFRNLVDQQEDIYMDLLSSTRTQILFSEWREKCLPEGYLGNLNLTDRAQVMFHLQFNPLLEQVYQISLPIDKSSKIHYLGGCGMVMSYSYKYPTSSNKSIRLQVQTIHVNLSWLLSGMMDRIEVQPIYPNRYESLSNRLNREGIKGYSLYSEYALGYIISTDPLFISPTCSDQIEESILEKLQSKLKIMGVDPRVIWKYTFAKKFILKNQLIAKEFNDVASVIKKSEEVWVIRKLKL